MWTTIVLVLTLVAIYVYKTCSRPHGFPPGPLALPVVGSVLSIFPGPKVTFPKFQKLYGAICSFKVFNNWTILISDPPLMKQVLADPVFSDRISLLLFLLRDELISGKNEPLGILGTSGHLWKEQRRFTLRSLKDLGFGRNSLEPVMQQELEELIHLFDDAAGNKFEVGLTFNSSIVNVIWAMVIGKRFSHSDKKLQVLVDSVNKMTQHFNPFHPAYRFPIIKKLFPNLNVYKCQDKYMRELMNFVEEELDSHQKELEEGDASHSYVAAYLKEIQEAKAAGRDTTLDMFNLKANISELFLAGSETTSSTMVWAVYLMAKHPHVLARVQQEMDDVVGQDHMPSLSHLDSLPYTTATIYEVQRMADLVPFAIPHRTSQPSMLEGYHIPAGTNIMFNLSHGLRDTNYWKYPDEFHPEHFIDDQGKLFKPEAFMPFGSGKRVCLGESLARLELFLFFTTLMHRFSWRLADDPVVWEEATVLSRPPVYKVLPTPRNVLATF